MKGKRNAPGPGQYSMTDDKVVRRSPQYSMGMSIRDSPERGHQGNSVGVGIGALPGPGTYDPKPSVSPTQTPTVQRASPLFGMRGKTNTDKTPNQFVPGPGQYTLPTSANCHG